MWHSTTGFLVVAGSLVLAWSDLSRRWRPRTALLRLCSFGVGFAVALAARPGVVPLGEAAWCGWVACLIVALLRAMSRFRMVALGLLAISAPALITLHPLRTVPRQTPAASGLAFEEVRFCADDGVRLAGWLVPHPHGQANVIFCHGHGRNRGDVSGLLETLHGLGLNVLAFDFRGHGDSDGHTCTFGVHEIHDLTAAAALLQQRFPGRPLFVVGISLGAAVSLQALPDLPEVAGLWSEGAFSDLHGVGAHVLAWMPAAGRRMLLAYYDWLGKVDAGVGLDIRPVVGLGAAKIPVCFCHGRQDELVPFEQGQLLYATHTGPKGCLWVEASHNEVRLRHHDEYLSRLKAFLEHELDHMVIAGTSVLPD